MRAALCFIFTFAAAASRDSALGHLSLVQRTAQLRAQRSPRIVADSGNEETGITDVMDGIKDALTAVGRSATSGEKSHTATVSSSELWRPVTTNKECSLLVFVPIGSFEQSGQFLKGNLEHLHSTLEDYCDVTVFLNHCDGFDGQDYWIQQTDRWKEGWYRQHVQFSTTLPGLKFQLMQELLRQVDMRFFTWVWALDEDFDIKHTDVKRALQLTEQSGALISIPAFTQVGSNEEERELIFPMQSPNSDCLYRYADVVEDIFPIFRTKAMELILWDCDRCIGETAVWGLNRIWCSYAARKLEHDRSTACAIIDGAPMVHQNFKTLKNKYDNSDVSVEALSARKIAEDFEAQAREWMSEVQKRFSEDFVVGDSKVMNSTTCVRA